MKNYPTCVVAGLLLLVSAASCAPQGDAVLEEILHYDTSGWAHDVALESGLLYVSDRQGGYLILNRAPGGPAPVIHAPVQDVISLAPNSGRPLLAARFEGLVLVSEQGRVLARVVLPDIANAAVTRGHLGFGAYGLNGLVVVRIGEGELNMVSKLSTPGWSHDIKLWEDRALLADWNYGMRVVDISQPELPAEMGVLPTPATAISISLGESGGKTMAAVAEGHGGVSIVAFDAAGRPSLAARHSLGLRSSDAPHPETGGWAHGVAWCQNYLFVANWKLGLAVLDVTDPRSPRVIRELPTAGTSLGVKAERAADGSILVYLADGENGLRIFRFR